MRFLWFKSYEVIFIKNLTLLSLVSVEKRVLRIYKEQTPKSLFQTLRIKTYAVRSIKMAIGWPSPVMRFHPTHHMIQFIYLVLLHHPMWSYQEKFRNFTKHFCLQIYHRLLLEVMHARFCKVRALIENFTCIHSNRKKCKIAP